MSARSPYDLEAVLGRLQAALDQVVREQTSTDSVRLIQRIRGLARERRVGMPRAQQQLAELIASLPEEELLLVVRSLATFFDLANLAEDRQRVAVLRERQRRQGSSAREQSIGAALARLKEAGLTASEVQTLLDRVVVDLVFTAHPTEAKRRTTRTILRQMRENLASSGDGDLLPGEAREAEEQLKDEITLLWQTDQIRPRPPGVIEELKRGLFFTESLWEVAPRIMRDLREALAEQFGGSAFRHRPLLRFGSWMGGDRDGNPYVTPEVTRQTLRLMRQFAVRKHREIAHNLERVMAISQRLSPAAPELDEQLRRRCELWPGLHERIEDASPLEAYRRWLRMIMFRLDRTAEADVFTRAAGQYGAAAELLEDIEALASSLQAAQGRRIVRSYIQPWLDRTRVFGISHAALDVRQDSQVYRAVVDELLADQDLSTEERRCAALMDSLGRPLPLEGRDVSAVARETLDLFRLLAATYRSWGPDVIGGHVVSMTHEPSDILTVLWFWDAACREAGAVAPWPLPLIPLLETIDDLHRGPQLLERLLTFEPYREMLRRLGDRQMVMVGYSDSTKDGGYLSATWALYQGQDELVRSAREQGIELVFFHGRGGALGRGGGPAARAILSLPPKTVNHGLRMTEQGEVLAERYDDPEIAHRHLEQVAWATLLVAGVDQEDAPARWRETLTKLAARSRRLYRALIEHAGFLDYFGQATPINDIETLPIGSRPARRRKRESLSDLRAIPWTFAWTQCRQMIPAWFGLGGAVEEAVAEGETSWEQLGEMYRRWPHFTATVDNAELALAKADMGIAACYTELCDAGDLRDIWERVRREYDVTRGAVLMITGETDLLNNTPWLQRSIQERNPYVDPLNFIQVELIRRRATTDDPERLERQQHLARLTVQAIAAGVRTTG